MATKLKLVPNPFCPCGKTQTTGHILQECPNNSALGDIIWSEDTALQTKLYSPREDSTFRPAVRTDDLTANDRRTSAYWSVPESQASAFPHPVT